MADLRTEKPAGPGGKRQSLDAQVEEMLHDIEGASPFVVRAAQPPEDLDPSDPVELEFNEDNAAPGVSAAVESHEEEHDDQLVEQVEQTVAEQEQRQVAEEEAAVRRMRLSRVLAAAIAALVVLAIVVGALICFNTCRPQEQHADPSALDTASAGAEVVEFRPVEASEVPTAALWFGKKLSAVKKNAPASLVFEDELEEAADMGADGFKYMSEASVTSSLGEQAMTFTFGLDEGKRIVYAYCAFDLDVLGVADARLEQLAADDTVPRSLLSGLGVDTAGIPVQALTAQENTMPRTVDEVESCEFEGETGLARSPQSWTLTESYDHTVGKLAGDNSVMRTIVVELL